MHKVRDSETSNGPNTQRTPIALTIAGSDSGGGAGIQADLKTFSALGVYGASVLTALTAQNTQSVTAIHDVPADFVAQQMVAVLSDLDVCAIKIGMLSSIDIIKSVSTVLREFAHIPVVLDPVMVAKSGDSLLQADAVDTLLEYLCPQASIITPNIPEAARLLGTTDAKTLDQMHEQARSLSQIASCSILLKGGHLDATHSTDILYMDAKIRPFEFARINTRNTHGTGCTLSSAIAAGIAKGLNVETAIEQATHYVHQSIAFADTLQIGHGHGPVHHFHNAWKNT